MNTLSDLYQQTLEHDLQKDDFCPKVKEVSFDDSGRLVVPTPFGAASLPMTDHALRQTCGMLKEPPYTYMKNCSLGLMASNLNYWQEKLAKRSPHERWFVRSYKSQARAVLSQKYTRVNGSEVLKAMIDVIGTTPHKLVRPYIDPDYIHVKITVADTDNYAIGCYVCNGETGNYQMKVAPFIQRHSCTNSIIYQDGGWEHKHIYISSGEVFAFVKGRVGAALKLSAEMIDAVVRAEAETIPDIGDVVADLCKKHRLSPAVQSAVLIGTEGAHSLMGLINGFSYAAHQVEMNPDDRIGLESLAGSFFAKVMKQEAALL